MFRNKCLNGCLSLLCIGLTAYGGVYLRDASVPVTVTGASNTTPVVITAPGHGFENGDIVFIEAVLGNTAANGLRKVKNVSGDTFEITDLNNQNVAGNGTFSASAQPVVGLARFTNIGDHPRIIFWPSSVRDRITDPDGDGPQVAPCVQHGSPCTPADRSGCTTWDALEGVLAGKTTPGCNGQTPELCPNEDGWGSSYTFLAALGWYADRSRTAWLTGVRYRLNRLERIYGGKFTACDESAIHCGRGSENDWISEHMGIYAMAYSLVESALSSSEKAQLRAKFFNDRGSDVGEDCTNMLQRQSGVANVTNGSATVTGSGLSAYTAGDNIYFKTGSGSTTGMWRVVAQVISDSELTLTTTSSVTASNIAHYRVVPWTTGYCGLNWFAAHHGYNPWIRYRAGIHSLSEAMDASQTTLVVSSRSNWLDDPPFYLKVDNEWMLATEVTGSGPYTVTVQRGVLHTTAASHSAGALVHWKRYPLANYGFTSAPTYYLGEVRHNLTLQKIYGFLIPALVFAEDDSRAAIVARDAWAYWRDRVYPELLNQWTGITGGASNMGYGWGRWLTFVPSFVIAAKYGFDPSQDYTAASWLKQALYWPIYGGFPHARTYTATFSDSGSGTGGYAMENDDVKLIALVQELYAGSPEAAYSWYWLRNDTNWLSYSMQVSANGQEMIPYYLGYTDSSTPSSNYNTLPTAKLFAGANQPFAAAVSRGAWLSNSAAHVTIIAPYRGTDHWASYPGPGHYHLTRGTRLLAGASQGGYGSGTGTSYVQVGTSTNLLSGDRDKIYAWRVADSYAALGINSAASYVSSVGVSAAYRWLAHLKGTNDYVVVYDYVATSSTQQKRTRLHYYTEGATVSFTRDGLSIDFTRGSAGRVFSRIVLPDDVNKVSDTQGTYARTVVIDDGLTTASEFLVVHKPVAGTSGTAPEVSLLSSDSASRVVALDDAQVVRFARGSATNTASFAWSSSGSFSAVVTGLTAGSYKVYKDGEELSGPYSVSDTEKTLSFDSSAGSGTYSVAGVPPPIMSADPTSLSFSGSGSQSLKIDCNPGTCSVTLSENCTWLSLDPTSGSTPLTSTVSVSASSLPPGTYSCTIVASAPEAANSPIYIPVNLTVTESGPERQVQGSQILGRIQ